MKKEKENNMRKTGFIAIVGRPNVGKSTLLNQILGEKVAIVSSKPQTTRNRIIGIHTVENNQFVFLDTPGMFRPKNSLGSYMVKTASSTMQEADAIILVADTSKQSSEIEDEVIEYAKKTGVPCILALNKIDLCRAQDVANAITAYAAKYDFTAFVPICAKNGKGVDGLLKECGPFLTESDFFFPVDEVTDQSERQVDSEVIREKILRTLNKEIPHGVAVVIEEFKEEGKLISIRAEIYCEKASHKGIIVGKNGEELKRVGSYARADLEAIFGTKVYLNLWVKVKENWRDSQRGIVDFGYREE